MVAAAEAFRDAGFLAFRGDLPFRQRKSTPRGAPEDRAGIRRAAEELRKLAPGVPVVLGGQSYGGRMCTMLAAEDPGAADALLLLSYPLRPPKPGSKPRMDHFPSIRTPVLFVHGTRDPFGTIEEIQAAARTIPAFNMLFHVEKVGHSLPPAVAASLPLWLSGIIENQCLPNDSRT